MADEKRYFWLKLYDDFFTSLRIKKLRRLAGGDTFLIIYLKMQLVAMKHDGVLSYPGTQEEWLDNLSTDIDEDIENVRITISFLIANKMAEPVGDGFFLPYSVSNVGSECSSAQRVREMRERNKALQCNNNVALCNTEIEIDKEIDIESEIEIEKPKRKKFVPPSLDDVIEYAKSRNSTVDAKAFWEYYNAGNWQDKGGNQVKNWKQKFITWETHEQPKPKRMQIEEQTDSEKIERMRRMFNSIKKE